MVLLLEREVDVIFRSFQIQIMKWGIAYRIAMLCYVCLCVGVCFFSCCKSRSSFGNVQNLTCGGISTRFISSFL